MFITDEEIENLEIIFNKPIESDDDLIELSEYVDEND